MPEFPFDNNWVQRVSTWDDFLERGKDVAMSLRRLQYSAADYDRDFRELAPELHDLVLEVFSLTEEEDRDLREWVDELDFLHD